MKKLLMAVLLALVVSTMMAAPAIPGLWKQRRMTDGTVEKVQKHGDEHGVYWIDAQGRCYVEDIASGCLKPAERHQVVKAAAEHRKQVNGRRASRRILPGDEHQPYTGSKKGLIILANFSDVQFEAAHDRQLYDDAANKVGFTSEYGHQGSVHDYFLDQSNQQFDLSFDVVGPIQLKHERAYYGTNGSDSESNVVIDPNAPYMIKEACEAVDAQVNFADYDWDDDGVVDQVMVIYPGHGENGIGSSETIWPHEAQLSWSQIELTLDGKTIDTYACTSELTTYQIPDEMGNYITGLDGIGTLCHEFSHCLGLPDMYDTGDGIWYGMGTWDLMDGGAYNGGAFLPASFTAYERMYAGWQQPVVLSTQDVQVQGMKALTDGGETYIIYNDKYKDEYYLLENRQPTKWDRGLYGKGLLVTHVDYMPVYWENNWVNYSDILSELSIHQRCFVVAADNSFGGLYDENNNYVGGDDIAGDTYPYGSKDSLTNTSYPRAMLYNANTDGSDRLNHAITGITQNADGTVDFYYRAVDSNTEISDDVYRTGKVFFKETFDKCAGVGGNDGYFDMELYSIGIKPFVPDNTEGWTPNAFRGANKCARFGDKVSATKVYTPDFAVEGKAYLTFKAAAITGESRSLKLGVDVWTGSATLSETDLTLNDDRWTDCRVAITGTGFISVTFTAQQRVLIDEVLVQAPLPLTEGIEDLSPALSHGEGAIFDLQGRRLNAVPAKGLYIKDGKKFVSR